MFERARSSRGRHRSFLFVMAPEPFQRSESLRLLTADVLVEAVSRVLVVLNLEHSVHVSMEIQGIAAFSQRTRDELSPMLICRGPIWNRPRMVGQSACYDLVSYPLCCL